MKCWGLFLKTYIFQTTILGKTLPKVQWTQGIEYFDSTNTFWSKQKLQKVLNSWSNTLQLDFVRQRARKNRKTSTNLSSNFEKSRY